MPTRSTRRGCPAGYRRPDVAEYDVRAQTYDATRSASPSTLRALLAALGPPSGRSLLDIGGGTGNYATALTGAGFDVAIADASREMLRRAAKKLSTARLVLGDALHLPFGDSAFDCAVSVNVSHHLPDWRRHIREAQRIIGAGVFAIQINTRENLEAHWIFHYFPQAKELTLAYHPGAEEVEQAVRAADFSRVERHGYVFEDANDGTFEALKHWPERYLDPEYRRNTSFFRRLAPEVERDGIARLHADYDSGALSSVIAAYAAELGDAGDSTVFAGWR